MHSPWNPIDHSQNRHWEKQLHDSPRKIQAHSSPCSLLHWWMGARPRTELFMCCYPSPELIQALGSAVKFSSLWGPFTTTAANQPSNNKKQLSSRSYAGQKYSSRVRLCSTIFTSPRTSMIYRITKSLRLERCLRSPSPTITAASPPFSPSNHGLKHHIHVFLHFQGWDSTMSLGSPFQLLTAE